MSNLIELKVSQYNRILQLLKKVHVVGSSAILHTDTIMSYNILQKIIGNHHYTMNDVFRLPDNYVYIIPNVDDIIEQLTIGGRKDKIYMSISDIISISVSFKDTGETKSITLASLYDKNNIISTKMKYVKDSKSYQPVSDTCTISIAGDYDFSDIINKDYDIVSCMKLSDNDANTLISGGLISKNVMLGDSVNTVIRFSKSSIPHISASTKVSDQSIVIHLTRVNEFGTATMIVHNVIKDFEFVDIYKFIPYTV